jgi:hypothetical protein
MVPFLDPESLTDASSPGEAADENALASTDVDLSSTRDVALAALAVARASGAGAPPAPVSNLDATRIVPSEPDVSKADASEPDVSKADASKPDVSKADASKPDVATAESASSSSSEAFLGHPRAY